MFPFHRCLLRLGCCCHLIQHLLSRISQAEFPQISSILYAEYKRRLSVWRAGGRRIINCTAYLVWRRKCDSPELMCFFVWIFAMIFLNDFIHFHVKIKLNQINSQLGLSNINTFPIIRMFTCKLYKSSIKYLKNQILYFKIDQWKTHTHPCVLWESTLMDSCLQMKEAVSDNCVCSIPKNTCQSCYLLSNFRISLGYCYYFFPNDWLLVRRTYFSGCLPLIGLCTFWLLETFIAYCIGIMQTWIMTQMVW